MADSGFSRTGNHAHPTGPVNRPGLTRKCLKTRAARPAKAARFSPGRGKTATGTARTISRHRSHRGNCARLSAPINHTNCARGNRLRNSLTVSAVNRVPHAASTEVARIRRPSAIPRADASRSSSEPIAIPAFKGFPGETSNHT